MDFLDLFLILGVHILLIVVLFAVLLGESGLTAMDISGGLPSAGGVFVLPDFTLGELAKGVGCLGKGADLGQGAHHALDLVHPHVVGLLREGPRIGGAAAFGAPDLAGGVTHLFDVRWQRLIVVGQESPGEGLAHLVRV